MSPRKAAANHRSSVKGPHSNSDATGRSSAHNRRVEQTLSHRRAARDQQLTAKRFRLAEPSLAENENDTDLTTVTQDVEIKEFTEEDVKQLQHDLSSGNKAVRLEALRLLSRSLTQPSDALIQFVQEEHIVPILNNFLTGTNADEQLLATWCISNIAAGDIRAARILELVPHLIRFLEESNIALQEQASYALGNLAAEDSSYRDHLHKNGVILPLVHLLKAAAPVSASKDHLQLAQTACFALSNLMRGHTIPVEELLSAGLLSALKLHFKNNVPVLVSELSWVLTYLTADEPGLVSRVLDQEPIINSFVHDQLLHFTEHGGLVIPLLRTASNIVANAQESSLDTILKKDLLKVLAETYLHSSLHAVRKEAAWLLANVTSLSPESLEALEARKIILPQIWPLWRQDTFDVRHELVQVIVHMAQRDPLALEEALQAGCMLDFTEILGSDQVQWVSAALHFFYSVLETHPNGFDLLEQAQGLVDALEAVARDTRHLQDEHISQGAGQLLARLEALDEARLQSS